MANDVETRLKVLKAHIALVNRCDWSAVDRMNLTPLYLVGRRIILSISELKRALYELAIYNFFGKTSVQRKDT